MQHTLRITLVLGALTLAGCGISAGDYVFENSGGNYVVRGTVVSIEELSTTNWQQLSQGFAVITDTPGCIVVLEQELNTGAMSQTRLELIAGDRIIISGNGTEGEDYVISALRNSVGIDVDPSGQKERD